jgi:hypothetical protein
MMIDSSKMQSESKPAVNIESPIKPADADYSQSEWYYNPNGNLGIVSSDGILILRIASFVVSSSLFMGSKLTNVELFSVA